MRGLIHSKRPIPGIVGAALITAATVAVFVSQSNAATISLTDATPGSTNVFSDTTSGVSGSTDSSVTVSPGIKDQGGSYYVLDSGNTYATGTVSFTFDVAPESTSLNLTGTDLFAPRNSGQTDPTTSNAGISLDYSLTGGNSGSGNLFDLLTLNQGTINGTYTVAFNVSIPLTPAVTDTFVTLTFTTTPGATNNAHYGGYEEQVLTNTAPFVATASFAPEPGTLALLGLSSLGLLGRRRRAMGK